MKTSPDEPAAAASGRRVALGVAYDGRRYLGWQSQTGGQTVQDRLEAALGTFAAQPIRVTCAGRTDAGVHALNQVVHFDTDVAREAFSWVRGTNRYLDTDIAVQWCREVSGDFHARNGARGRRYAFLVLESAVRPALEADRCGWVFRTLDADRMARAAQCLIGTHDFSAFRSGECQAHTPIKTLRTLDITRHGAYWRFDFEASAFLHHMVRNIMGCLVAVGSGARDPGWMAEVLASRSRERAAPTFPPDGLYFVGPYYDAGHGIPTDVPALGWLPGGAR